MNQPPRTAGPVTPFNWKSDPVNRVAIAFVLVGLCFSLPLYRLAVFALHNDLYSHIVLIPIVSAYLVWTKRSNIPAVSSPSYAIVGIFILLGGLTLGLSFSEGFNSTPDDYLSGKILAFFFLLMGASAWLLGTAAWRSLSFPLGFLIFMVPFPTELLNHFETFLQHASAAVALIFFRLAGTSVFHHDLLFQLRGINLEVAPECSGIHSTLALFITSVIAGHFFLRSRWKCMVLTLAVIPLALLRNGFRIFTIGELCVHISPDMIDSYIHHKGGPIFFALSLIPFFLLLRLLYKSEPNR